MLAGNNLDSVDPEFLARFDQLDAKYIRIKVFDQLSNEIHFKVKHSTLLWKLKKAYSDRVGVPLTCLRFLIEGRRIDDDETPNTLEMEKGDWIEVQVQVQEN